MKNFVDEKVAKMSKDEINTINFVLLKYNQDVNQEINIYDNGPTEKIEIDVQNNGGDYKIRENYIDNEFDKIEREQTKELLLKILEAHLNNPDDSTNENQNNSEDIYLELEQIEGFREYMKMAGTPFDGPITD